MDIDARIKKLDARRLNDREIDALTNVYTSHRASEDDIDVLNKAVAAQGIQEEPAA